MASDTSGGTATAEPKLPSGFEDHKTESLLDRVQHVLHGNPILGPLAVLVVAIIAFAIVNGRFLSAANLGLVLQQVTVIATLALGQTLVILTAGIDLSAGAIAVFSSILMANMATKLGFPGFLAIIIGLVLGTAMGAFNGWLVTRVKLPPFIVTLGTLSIFTALTLIYAQGQVITLDKGFLVWTGNTIGVGGFNITTGVLMMLLLYIGFAYALRQTAWGRHLYATGDDAEAARLAGIRTNRVLLSAYVVCGAVVGITAWIQIGRINGSDPNAAINLNLESITAVVIGGTSLFGGRGVIVGSLIGALIVQVFDNGLALAGVDPNYQVLAVGVLVIVAVAADQWIRSVKS